MRATLRTALFIVAGMIILAGGSAAAKGKGKASAPAAPAPAAKDASGAPSGAAGSDGEQPKVKVERGAGGKKIYRITEEIRIEGKIQKPEAFFFYQKSSINYDWQELKQEFVPKILESVRQSPF